MLKIFRYLDIKICLNFLHNFTTFLVMANSGPNQQMLKTILIWSSTIVIPASVIPKLELFSNEIRSVLVCAGIKQAKYEWSIFDQMLCIFNVSRIELHTEHEKLKIWRLNNCNFMLNWRLLLTPRPATPRPARSHRHTKVKFVGIAAEAST